jgi:Domain of unknown function (DUF1906)
MTYLPMADAAFAANIPPGFDIAAGYYGGQAAYHVWAPGDWARFPGYRLPIWVPGNPGNGPADGKAAVAALKALGVPPGSIVVVDMETRRDKEYVTNFNAEIQAEGYKLWVYGSVATVFGNPPCNGYWVADYGISMADVTHVLQLPHVRAVQYATSAGFDTSLVKAWTEGEMWRG